jgi:hypothetical protein
MRWGEFAMVRPDLAEAGRALLYQYGVGLAFLATTRADGGPRVHPMCPLLTATDLYAFLVPSPKRRDLHRDGRYALHTFPAERNEDAFSLNGRAVAIADEAAVAALTAQYAGERGLPEPPGEIASWELFAFDVESALLTRTTGHGDPSPVHTVWLAGPG